VVAASSSRHPTDWQPLGHSRLLRLVAARRWKALAGWLAALAGTLVTTAIIGIVYRWVRVPNISLLYLFPVVAVAGTWGRGPAIAAAILAFLSFDWFFVQPFHTFTVDDPAEWLALGVFLLAALYAAQLTAALRQQAQEARQRAWEATSLHTLASALAAAHDLPELLSLARDEAMVAFRCADCAVRLEDGGQTATGPFDVALPLTTPRGVVGTLWLTGPSGQTAEDRGSGHFSSAFAAQIALAVERVRLQEGATQAEVLRRTDALRAALLSAVSHDLRTPLTAMKAAATSLLQHDVAWSEEERDGFAVSINRGVDRLNRLVTNLLDLSRIEAGALKLNCEPYLLADLVQEAVAQTGPLFSPGQVMVDLHVDGPALPWVRVDPILIEQVLVNLLENAAKYSLPGSAVTIRASIGADQAIVHVEDQGPGIDPSELDRVFERFYRVGGQRRVSGVGIGLAVCKGIVEGHGGRIWATSTVGRGSTFSFSVPLEPEADHGFDGAD